MLLRIYVPATGYREVVYLGFYLSRGRAFGFSAQRSWYAVVKTGRFDIVSTPPTELSPLPPLTRNWTWRRRAAADDQCWCECGWLHERPRFERVQNKYLLCFSGFVPTFCEFSSEPSRHCLLVAPNHFMQCQASTDLLLQTMGGLNKTKQQLIREFHYPAGIHCT